MTSLFKSEEGKKEILALYHEKLNELQIPFESQVISTSFGETHLLITGDPSNPPLLLVHGSNACAPIALECYPALRKKYRVYAVDVIAQPTKSAETRVSMKDDSYGKWMNELIEKLHLNNLILAGFSLGGLIILKTLMYDEQRIKEAFIASPAYIVNGNPLVAFFNVFLPMRRYMRSKKIKFVEKFLSALFTDRDPFAVKFLSVVFLQFSMDFTPVPTISKTDAKRITTPITIVGAEKDIIFPGKKMIKRAQHIFPSLKQTILLENSKHVQNSTDNKVLEGLILKTE
ncbi:MAG: alpha/beta hydrolase [Saprospiraceae bacterium]|nr:alpha/beta hydrolase [Saprospiraceae bacterium]